MELAVEFDVKAYLTDKPPFNNGKNLYIRAKNLRHGVTVPFDQRSKGFIWFFSFMVWSRQSKTARGRARIHFSCRDEPRAKPARASSRADFLAQHRQALGGTGNDLLHTFPILWSESDRY